MHRVIRALLAACVITSTVAVSVTPARAVAQQFDKTEAINVGPGGPGRLGATGPNGETSEAECRRTLENDIGACVELIVPAAAGLCIRWAILQYLRCVASTSILN